MQLFRTGAPGGPTRIGYGRDARPTIARLKEASAHPFSERVWELPAGTAMLAERLVRQGLGKAALGDGWFDVSSQKADAAIVAAIDKTTEGGIARLLAQPPRPWAGIMAHIRERVFETTQDQIGLIAGKGTATVSRWESGAATPGVDELLRIRAYAKAVGLPWDDTLLFDPAKALPTD